MLAPERRIARSIATVFATAACALLIGALLISAESRLDRVERPLLWLQPLAELRTSEPREPRVKPRDTGTAKKRASLSMSPSIPPTALPAPASPEVKELVQGPDLASPDAMHAKVLHALQSLPDADAGKPKPGLAPNPQSRLEAGIASATAPDCKGPDALRNDPPHLGPIPLGGLLALPFLGHAMLTGKCRL